MYSVLNKGKAPVKLWSPIHEVESAALDQLTNIANLPCVFRHIAVMPDVHLGKGATVGSVVATKGAVIPAAVGVDIGCGMMAARLPVTSHALPVSLSDLRSEIEKRIPVGHRQHQHPVAADWWGFHDFVRLPHDVQNLGDKAEKQLGTLGGGNHFIEICLDTEDRVWAMLHSGSRNIGKSVADVHISRAKDLMKRYFIGLLDPDLAYLAEGTREFQDYMKDVSFPARKARPI